MGISPTVRVRTTVLATLVAGLALAFGSLTLVRTLDHSLVTSGDGIAQARTQELVELARHGALPDVLTNVEDNGVAQVVDGSGLVLAASANVQGAGPLTADRPAPGTGPVVRVVDATDDNEPETYRMWIRTESTPSGTVTAYSGTSLEAVPEASRALRGLLWVGTPLTVLLIGLASWLLTGRALRPVEAIRAEVAGISGQALDRRVPVPPADDEIRRLAVTMNDMLDRLDDAHRRQRDFVADASHELQSPVAAIRTQLEVALAHPDGTDWRGLANDLLSDCGQMERLVHDLLFLARDGVAPAATTLSLLDLDDLVFEECARARTMTTVRIETGGVSAAPVRGSADELRRLVRNLLENAVRHARSQVRVGLTQSAGLTRLDISDDGPGVPPSERERIFDRFYRGDDSRSRESGGTGLGLPIARAIAEHAGGRVELADSQVGAHFVVTLPSA